MAATETVKRILKSDSAEKNPVGVVYENNADYVGGSLMHRIRQDEEGVWRTFCGGREATYSYRGTRAAVTCAKCRLNKEPKQ